MNGEKTTTNPQPQGASSGLPGNPTPAHWAAWIAKLDANKVVARVIEDSAKALYPARAARLRAGKRVKKP
jgi:hypothetical protein